MAISMHCQQRGQMRVSVTVVWHTVNWIRLFSTVCKMKRLAVTCCHPLLYCDSSHPYRKSPLGLAPCHLDSAAGRSRSQVVTTN